MTPDPDPAPDARSDGPSLQERFVDGLGFRPDRFQLEAFDGVDEGKHVIVAAPTGAGKTLVASYAVERALARGRRVFYTTPIKALSNQKYLDFVDRFGRARVGLLTGDNAINSDAPVVVMTTEVLRNMIYAGDPLDRLVTVVLDEVHYLQDAYRGPVWEEVIIHLPHSVQLVCLSATVSNSEELAEWIETVRGPARLVVEHRRPVELENLYLVAERGSPQLHLMPVVQGDKPNPKAYRFDSDPRRGKGRKGGRNQRNGKKSYRTPGRTDVVRLLADKGMLPAIFFIFSRNGCSEAARSVLHAGIELTTAEERSEIDAILAEHTSMLSPEDLEVLGYASFRAALRAGVAPHHAGLVPPWKEAVEAAFSRGLAKVVFATETLALGINMPARTVVIDKLTKFTGDHHEFLTPAQYTQLTGRAGRRGIDTHGRAVILWSPWVRFDQVAGLAQSRNFQLTSSFRPTYNMAANLVRRYDPERAHQLLNLSFAQFRADAAVVRSEGQVEKLVNRRRQLAGRLEREFGPEAELRAAAGQSPGLDRAELTFALSRCEPGNVLTLESDTIPSPVLVLSVAYRGGGDGGRVKVVVCDTEAETWELTAADLDAVPLVAADVALPQPYLPNSVSFIHEAAKALGGTRLASPRKRRSLGPTGAIRSSADLPHAAGKALRRLDRLDTDLAEVRSRSRSDAETLARQFDRVLQVLEDRGHLEGWSLTAGGQRLARLYQESDLLIVEALDEGLFDDLSPAEIAGLASTFCYDERRPDAPETPWFPTSELRRRVGRLSRLHHDLTRAERAAGLPETRRPDGGFAAMAFAWASGGDLDEVIGPEDLTAGDFVRTTKQLIDLLGQLAVLAPSPLTAQAASVAADAVHRDLVAAASAVGGETG